MKSVSRYLSVLLALNLHVGTASADAANLCVRPIVDRTPMDAPIAQAAGKIVSRRSQDIAPSRIELPPGGKFPLIYDAFTEELRDGIKRNRTFIWQLDSAAQLTGPYDLDGEKISYGNGPSAADASGRILFIVGLYDAGEPQRIGNLQIYSQEWGQRPTLLRLPPQADIGEPRGIFWSDLQNAFLIQGMTPDPQTGGVRFSANVLSEAGVQVLDDFGVDFASDLRSLGVTALLGSNTLTFIDRDGVTSSLGRMKPALQGSWQGIYETSDDGWLYVDGDEYDHAVRIERVDGQWRIASLIRLVNNEGPLDPAKDQTRMQKEGLSEIIRTDPCRAFSAAIGRMVMCRGQIQELRAGALVPIDNSEKRKMQFLGDATPLGLALFQDEDGQIYGYDGDRLHQISGTLSDRVRVNDLPSSKRTFLATDTSLFELQREGNDLRLEKMIVPSSGSDLFFTRFFDISGEVVALLRQGAYVVDNPELRPIWVPGEPEQVDTTSQLKPSYIPQLSGVLFASSMTVTGVPRFHLLTHCSSSN